MASQKGQMKAADMRTLMTAPWVRFWGSLAFTEPTNGMSSPTADLISIAMAKRAMTNSNSAYSGLR